MPVCPIPRMSLSAKSSASATRSSVCSARAAWAWSIRRGTSLEKLLAVKLLLIAQNEEYQRRFLQEAQLASQINHPNTVFLSDFGVLPDGRSYIVMELLRGPTLASVISEGKMDPMRACRIAAQIAHGLQAVHDQGIIHRDAIMINSDYIR